MTSAPAAHRIGAVLGWNYGGALASVLLQLGYTAWTARTASHGAFGAYAIGLTLTQLLGLFAQAGLATCVLRSVRLTRAELRAAQRIALVTGLVCCVLAEVAAPLPARLFALPELTLALRVLGLQFLLLPLGTVLLAALRREGRPRQATVAELTGQVAGCVVSVALLSRDAGPAALAANPPVAALVTYAVARASAASLQLVQGDAVRALPLIRLSGFLTLFALTRSLAGNAPLWCAGRLLGPGAAGLYSRAQLLADVPLNVMVKGLNQAAVPALAERRGQGREIRTAAGTLVDSASVGLLAFGALAGAGPAALGLLLGPGWEGAADLVPALSLLAALQLLYAAGCSLDLARGARRAMGTHQAAVLVVTAAGLLLAWRWPSPVLVVGAAVAGLTAGHTLQLVAWRRAGLIELPTALRSHAVHATAGFCLALSGGWGAARFPGGAALPAALLAMVPVAAVLWLLRDQVPAYRAARRLGLIRAPRPRTEKEEPACVSP
ncbi:oligosaccharide flippase family protein [Streptomyces sp. YC504]|uniref:Oligosaccharide flippase family protein n=1 Tax=Streptomyces mesophilus TaxID=1775132 RepID=A0A6G4XGC4_9ACTN|nr:oligosaccharide flippase family protein [Streptomyces mesophilus]NGO76232.1 oligosaccharide flippase family protein [Streptomyces mesophilus]